MPKLLRSRLRLLAATAALSLGVLQAVAANQPPVAVASANITSGPSPLTVQFTGSNSFDPDGQSLTYRWDFGDGSSPSTQANPSHTFSAATGVPTHYVVTLTVSDGTASATAVSVYCDMEAGNNGNMITPALLQAATKGTAGVWSLNPSSPTQLTVSTDVEPRFPSLVLCNGSTYSDTASTRVLKIRNTVETQWCNYQLNNAAAKLSVGCFIRLGNFQGTTFAYFDIFALESDSGEFSVLSFVDGGGPGLIFQEHTSSGVGSPITVSGNTTYWMAMLWDQAARLATLKIYSSSTWTLLGTSTKSIPNGGTFDNVRSVILGRYDAHLHNGANSTNAIYYDDLMLDITGNQFPILPNTSTSSLSASTNLDICVNCGGNTAPTISDILNQTVTENGSTGPLSFSVSDAESPATSLTVTGSSSNPTLVPNANLVFGGSGALRNLTVTPAPNQSGSATITVRVSDGSLTSSDTFVLTVNPASAQSFLLSESFEGAGFENTGWITHGSANPDYTTLALQGAQSLNCVGAQYVERPFVFANSFYLYFQVRWNTWTDFNNIIYWDNSNYDIVLGLYADNNRVELDHGSASAYGITTLNAGVTYHMWVEWTKGTGANGTFKLFISTDGIKPTLPDGNISTGNGGAPARMYIGPTSSGPNVIFDRFLVDDVPIGSNPGSSPPSNQPPTISDIANQTVNAGTATGPLAFTVGDVETAAGSLTVTGTSSNPTLVPNANIVFGGSGASRNVTVTPAANQSGTATITVTVSDGALTASDSFVLTVNSDVATYLFTEGFEAVGFDNTGWTLHGTPDPDYTVTALDGTQSLNCSGAQYVERAFSYGNSFNLYFRVRWLTWRNSRNLLYWDDANFNVVGSLYAERSRLEINLGTASALGTTTISANVTYHAWVEWTRGTGANGTMKLFLSTTGIKPANPEAIINTGNGAAPARIYLGPTQTGPNMLFDRILVDDVPIGSNP